MLCGKTKKPLKNRAILGSLGEVMINPPGGYLANQTS